MEIPTENENTAQRLSRRERFQPMLKPLLLVFSVSLLAFVFAKLGSEINEGETHNFDMLMLQGAQALRLSHPWMAGVMRDLSGLGSEIVLTFITVATVGYLALISARATAVLVAASVISGTVLMNVLKLAFGRMRPGLAYAELSVPGLSFPSGHASMSAIVFLTIGALLASTHKRLAERVYILTAAVLLTLLVGLSRVALGVHWTTDVFGGWAFGAAWAMGWLLLARHLSRR